MKRTGKELDKQANAMEAKNFETELKKISEALSGSFEERPLWQRNAWDRA